MNLSSNVGGGDRRVRLILGIVLIGLGYFGVLSGTAAIVGYVVATIALVTGTVTFCPANTLLRLNSCKQKS